MQTEIVYRDDPDGVHAPMRLSDWGAMGDRMVVQPSVLLGVMSRERLSGQQPIF
jgi:hypothetical protein